MDNYEIVFLIAFSGKKLPERENNYKWVAYLALTIDRLIERIGNGWLDELTQPIYWYFLQVGYLYTTCLIVSIDLQYHPNHF